MATKDTFWRTLGIAVASMIVWAIVAGFFASKAYGQQDTVYQFVPIPVILMDSLPGGFDGVVVCDTFTNKPLVELDKHTVGKDFAETLNHEMVHIVQVWFRGCKQAMAEFDTDAHTRLQWEGQAYCQSLPIYNKGDELAYKLDILPVKLYERYGLMDEIPFSEVRIRVGILCGNPVVAARSP